jgi:hypothetical protein
VEITYGSLFYFRYSLLLMISEALISFLLIYYIRTIARANSQFQVASHFLSNVQSSGCSGMILGWLAFLSCVRGPLQDGSIIILGFFNVSLWYSPLIMILAYHICLLKGNLLYNWSGLCSGYLLGLGLLRILPDFYWSMCFILDVAFIVIASIVAGHISELEQNNASEGQRNRSFAAINQSSDDTMEVLTVPVSTTLTSSSSSTAAYRTVDTNDFDVEEVKRGEDSHAAESNSHSLLLPDIGRRSSSSSSLSSSLEGSRDFPSSTHHRSAGSRFIRQNDEDRRDDRDASRRESLVNIV